MGQTLTHGVYLPDEGERNCYSGLAANWQLLDNSVGTIAEHTTALAGKAGLTTNNTFSGTNSFSKTIYSTANLCINNSAYASGTPSNNIFYNPVSMGGFVNNVWTQSLAINGAVRTNGYNDFSIRVYSQTGNTLTGVVAEANADASVINFRPISNGTHNLGNSSYQWNNVYSKRVNTQTLNGINPGALSLPDYNSYLDVTSEVPVASLDGNTLINLDDYLSNKTGWLSIVIDDTAGNSILVTQGKTGGATAFNDSRSFHTGAQSGGYISVFMPLISGMSKKAFIKASSLIQMRFYYCLGNV